MTDRLRQEWFTEQQVSGVDSSQPGLYEWRVDGVCIYVGQYTHATRPRREYARNVARLLSNQPYRKGKPDAFRKVHRDLAKAVQDGRAISLILFENQSIKSERNRRERELIAERISNRISRAEAG